MITTINEFRKINENVSVIRIADKDWDRMLNLVLTSKDGAGVASTINDKNKAVARFVAGLKLSGQNPNFDERFNQYWGTFKEFGNRAHRLGATREEIQATFDAAVIPDKYAQKLTTLNTREVGLQDRFVSAISKAVLDAGHGFKIVKSGNALTFQGRDAMERSGLKWTIGYKTLITIADRTLNFNFDAITDEGDGPTYYAVDRSSDILRNIGGDPCGIREFLSLIKRELERLNTTTTNENKKRLKSRKMNENNSNNPNVVRFWTFDWKENPSKEDRNEMRKIAKLTNGWFEELNVVTADLKVFVAGPESFFDWYEKVSANGQYGDAFEMFMDAGSKWNDDNGDTLADVSDFYMNNDELWVEIVRYDENENEIGREKMSYVQWQAELNNE
jgi:hypothetical protein